MAGTRSLPHFRAKRAINHVQVQYTMRSFGRSRQLVVRSRRSRDFRSHHSPVDGDDIDGVVAFGDVGRRRQRVVGVRRQMVLGR